MKDRVSCCVRRVLCAVGFASLLCGLAQAEEIKWTGADTVDAQDWFRPGNWDLGRVPVDGDEVTIKPASLKYFYVTLTNSTAHLKSLWLGTGTSVVSKSPDYRALIKFKGWESCLRADDITLYKGGILTSAGSFNNVGPSNRVWVAGVNLTCTYYDGTSDRDGGITANACGYNGANGPCWVGGTAANGYSGAYGGAQGADTGVGSHVYGSAEWPFDPGSGGGNAGTSNSGGGAIFIDLTGDLVVNGTIAADSAEPAGTPSRASGGGIVINCATITGSGVISASACTGRSFGSSGGRNGGGGGRIAVHYDPTKQAAAMANCKVNIRALGGSGGNIIPVTRSDNSSGTSFKAGQPGTLWFPDLTMLKMSPLKLGGRIVNIDSNAELVFDSGLTLQEGVLGFDVPVKLKVNGDFASTSSAAMSYAYGLYFGTVSLLEVTGDASFKGSKLWAPNGGIYRFGGDLTLLNDSSTTWRSGGELDVVPASGAGMGKAGAEVIVGGAFKVNSYCTIFARSHPQTGEATKITAKTFELCANAAIDGTGLGYPAKKGPGYVNLCGASHGGKGAFDKSKTSAVADPYGNRRAPTTAGSGSNTYAGGGAVWIEAEKTLTMNGSIVVNGLGSGGSDSNKDGGAGGSVFLAARTLVSSGASISAVGGSVGGSGGSCGGGGGRIAIRQNDDTFDQSLLTLKVDGGSSQKGSNPRPLDPGSDGTIYWGSWLSGMRVILR